MPSGVRSKSGDPAGTVLFVSHSAVWGGAERILVDLAAGLGEPAIVLCARGALAERAAAAGLAVLTTPARAPELRGGWSTTARASLALAQHALEIRRVALSLRPRAVVAVGMRSLLGSAVALGTFGERPPLVFEHVDLLPSGAVGRAVARAAARADRVIALSDVIARDLDRSGRLKDRLHVVPPGVDETRFTATPPSADPPVVLVLGALMPWKRPELALEAVALAARRLTELRVVMAGHSVAKDSERLLADLERRAEAPDLRGRVDFKGALADPRPALREASCLLHCADEEPFGLVLLEAMASGRPVVAPSAAGPLEIVAGGSGELFTPGDAAAAARALEEVLVDESELRRRGALARRRVEERFTLAATRRRWAEAAAIGPGERARAGVGLTLVTVSHNSSRELKRLLTSVAGHLPAARTVVVDSGSEDDSVSVARAFGEAVRVLELNNRGYGPANNAGVAEVETEATVILNPDTELVDGSLAELAEEALQPGARPRLLAPLVLRPDGRRQDSVHPEPVSVEAALSALVPPAALPVPLRTRVQPWRANRPMRVAWAVGCCIAAPTDVLRRLGPFDERIFLYAEDLELGLRAGDAGIETWWWPGARLVHHGAHATSRAYGGEPIDMLARQRHAVVAERRGEAVARWDDRLQAATFANRIVLKTMLRRSTEREGRQLRAVRRSAGSRLASRAVAPRMHA